MAAGPDDERSASPDRLTQLRRLADERADRLVFDHLATHPEIVAQLAPDDYTIVAAALREAKRQPDAGASHVADLVAGLIGHVGPPDRQVGAAPAADYLDALLDWYEAILQSRHAERFRGVIAGLIRIDFAANPGVRERLVSLLAEIGLTLALADDVIGYVMSYVDKPYLFSEPRPFLTMLAFKLHRRLMAGDPQLADDPWLFDWCRYLATSRYSRRRRTIGRRSLIVLKDEIHRRIARATRITDILLGRLGSWRRSAIMLVIKLDCLICVSTGLSAWRPSYRVLRFLLRHLAQDERKQRRVASRAPARDGLAILEPGAVSGGANDILVTRAQGGLGDVMTMRPGLVELARHNPGGRVVFATTPMLFAAFSPDDPLDLVDIERAQLDHRAFGRWINLTNCPAVRTESAEFPGIRSNRIAIFAAALGVGDRQAARLPRLRFSPPVEAVAAGLLARAAPSAAAAIGIQLRSAEAYKDAPALLEVARTLADRYRVFVFDNRSIPRRPDDRFIAVDDQPPSVALALASRLDGLIAPDSALLHLAGVNLIPCLGLFGPTDGGVRTTLYPTVTALDLRSRFACVPCWRYRVTKCRRSDSFESSCMQQFSSADIIIALEKLLRSGAVSSSVPA